MSLARWSLDPSLVYVAPAAFLYVLGSRGRGRPAPLQAAAFFAGLLTIVVSTDSAIDVYADQLFWVHMVQHVLLLTVAPPLILFGRPWPRMWRALPLEPRTSLARTVARSSWTSPLRTLTRPLPAWLLFNATLVAWHIPAAYDATLTSGAVHAIEHAMFFFTGLLFWAWVIQPGPLGPRLVWPVRIAYAAGAMVVGWLLAITLVLVPHPLYGYYADLTTRPGGISALTDQQIAAGVMWVLGSISYTVTFLTGFYRWLEPDHATAPQRPAANHATTAQRPAADHATAPQRPAGDHATAAQRPGGDHVTAPQRPAGDHATAPQRPAGDHATAPQRPALTTRGGLTVT